MAQDTLTVDRLEYRLFTLENGVASPLTDPRSARIGAVFLPCGDKLVEFCDSENREFSVWVDGRLVRSNEEEKCFVMNALELCSYVARDTVLLSVVAQEDLGEIRIRTVSIVESETDARTALERTSNTKGTILLGFILGGVALFVIWVYTPIRSFLALKIRPDNQQPLNWFVLAQYVLLSILGALSWTYFQGGGFMIFLNALTVLLGFWIVKSTIYFLSARLFKEPKIAIWQFLFQMRFWAAAFSFAFILSMFYAFFIPNNVSPKWIVGPLPIAFTVLYLGVQIFTLSSYSRIKLLHRFIYLCTTEILAAVVVIHYFLK